MGVEGKKKNHHHCIWYTPTPAAGYPTQYIVYSPAPHTTNGIPILHMAYPLPSLVALSRRAVARCARNTPTRTRWFRELRSQNRLLHQNLWREGKKKEQRKEKKKAVVEGRPPTEVEVEEKNSR